MIGGEFTSVRGLSQNRIARLRPNGSVDPSFDHADGADATVYALALQSDGKILVGGSFTNFGGQSRRSVARLNADGSVDNTFNVSVDGIVRSIILRTNGHIFLGGSFTNINGSQHICAALLRPDGSVDESFIAGGNNAVFSGDGISSMALQNDGKLLVAGHWTVLWGRIRPVMRLLPDGTLDDSFQAPGFQPSNAEELLLQPDGRILVGGTFTNVYNPSCCLQFPRNGLVRLFNDGTIDGGFYIGSGAMPAAVHALELRDDLKLYVGGSFTMFAGTNCGRIARLHGDIPTRIHDWRYSLTNGMELVLTNEPGRIYVLEVSTNFTQWIAIATNSPFESRSSFTDVQATNSSGRIYRVVQLDP